MNIEPIKQGFVSFKQIVSDGCALVWKLIKDMCHNIWENIKSGSQVPETKKHTADTTKEKNFESGTVLTSDPPDQRGVVLNTNQSLQENNVAKKVHKENESIEEKQKESASESENDEEIVDVDKILEEEQKKEQEEQEKAQDEHVREIAEEFGIEIVDDRKEGD